MRTNELIEQLKALDLSEPEARLYIAGLKAGPSLLAPLAREARIPRSTVYNILEEMARKHIFVINQEGKRTLYVASPPFELLKQLYDKEHILKKLVPYLESFIPVHNRSEMHDEQKTQLPF